MTDNRPSYIGRFAPSPTGPLHLGSLVSALASYLDARAHGGRWLLRMEDIDPPREQPGAAQRIIDSLHRHGLHWDGEVLWQSSRDGAYDAALTQLLAAGQAYYCRCSRRQLKPYGGIHPAQCIASPQGPRDAAIRLRAGPGEIAFEDGIQGRFAQRRETDIGDFVLRRRDGLYAYQLAVAVDDDAQQITHVLRGSDLLDSTPRQMLVQRALSLPTPRYLHIPVILGRDGTKLSKQSFALPLDDSRAQDNLRLALRLLHHGHVADAAPAGIDVLLSHAVAAWERGRIPRLMGITAPAA